MSNVRRRNHGRSTLLENPRRQSRSCCGGRVELPSAKEGTYAVHTKRSMQKPGCSCCSGLRLVVRLRKSGRIESRTESPWVRYADASSTNAVVAARPKIVEFTWVRSKQRRAWSGVCERRRVLRVPGVNVLRWPRLRRSKEQFLRSQNLASLVATVIAERKPNAATPNPSIEGTSNIWFRQLSAAPHVKR